MTGNEKAELSKYCKTNCGLDAKEVADLAQVPRRTFYDWWTGRRRTVELIVLGVKAEIDKINERLSLINALQVCGCRS